MIVVVTLLWFGFGTCRRVHLDDGVEEVRDMDARCGGGGRCWELLGEAG